MVVSISHPEGCPLHLSPRGQGRGGACLSSIGRTASNSVAWKAPQSPKRTALSDRPVSLSLSLSLFVTLRLCALRSLRQCLAARSYHIIIFFASHARGGPHLIRSLNLLDSWVWEHGGVTDKLEEARVSGAASGGPPCTYDRRSGPHSSS